MKQQDIVPMRGPTSIHRVRLLDTQGSETNRFEAAQRARLAFDLALEKPPTEYLLGFGLKRVTDGLLVADYNLELPLDGDVRGPVPMVIDFAANLLSGSYSVTLFLLEKATYDKVVYLDFVKMFNVVEKNSIAGVVHVSPQVQCLEEASCAGNT